MEDISKKQAKIIFERANQQQRRGNFSEAIALYRQSIELQPSAEAHTYLGLTYSMLERYEDAIEQCKLAIEIDPEFGNPYNDIGSYLLVQGRPEEALEWIEQATKAARFDAPQKPFINMGQAFELQGQYRSAMHAYSKALQINPLDRLAYGKKQALVAKMN